MNTNQLSLSGFLLVIWRLLSVLPWYLTLSLKHLRFNQYICYPNKDKKWNAISFSTQMYTAYSIRYGQVISKNWVQLQMTMISLYSIIHCFVTSPSVLEAGPKKTSGLAVAKARLLRRVRSRSGRKPCKIPWKSQTLEHFWENESSAAAFVGVILSYDTSVYQDIPSMYACFRIPGKWRFLMNSQLLGMSAYLDDSINQKCSRKWNFKP